VVAVAQNTGVVRSGLKNFRQENRIGRTFHRIPTELGIAGKVQKRGEVTKKRLPSIG